MATRSDNTTTIQINDSRYVVGEVSFLQPANVKIVQTFSIVKELGLKVANVYPTTVEGVYVCQLEGYPQFYFDLHKI